MKLFRGAWRALCCLTLSAPAAFAEPTTVTLGTATPGGGFPVYGEAFAATVNEFEPALRIEPRNTKGSTENVPLLEAGQLDIALVQGEAAQGALGIDGSAPTLRIVAAMYSQPGLFVVRADSPARTIEDLKGKPVAFGTRGSGLTILSGLVLDGMGLDRDRDFQAIYLDKAGDGPPMVLEGRASALWGAGVGWPGFVRVAQSPAGARFIAPAPEDVRRILAKHPHLRALTVPPGSFPGQAEPIHSVGSWSFVLARPDLPDDVAYRIARALHPGEAAIAARLPQARETKPRNTIEAAPRLDLIHPGALRYLREAGFAP